MKQKIPFLFFILILSACSSNRESLKDYPTQAAQEQQQEDQARGIDSVDDYPLSPEVRDQYQGL